MTEDTFEPAACTEHGWAADTDTVTDEEFASWVKRSQRQTDAILAEWDAGAGALPPPDGWDDSVEFTDDSMEIPDDDDETVVFAIFNDESLQDDTPLPVTRRRLLRHGNRASFHFARSHGRTIYPLEEQAEPVYRTITVGRAQFDPEPPCTHDHFGIVIRIDRPGADRGWAIIQCARCRWEYSSFPIKTTDVHVRYADGADR